MSPVTVSPLRQRMIEDMKRSQAVCGDAEGSHSQLQAARRVSEAVA